MSNTNHKYKRCYKDKDIEICYDIRLAIAGASFIIITDVVLMYVFSELIDNIFLALASVGIVTFIGVLALADYVSVEHSVSTGEMRAAMTASITVVYLVMLAVTFSGKPLPDSPIIEHFSWVVGVVIVFYFGSKGVLQYIEIMRGKNQQSKQSSLNA